MDLFNQSFPLISECSQHNKPKELNSSHKILDETDEDLKAV